MRMLPSTLHEGSFPMSSFDPVTSRVPLLLGRLRRETSKDGRTSLGFATLCSLLSIPADLRPRLLRRLVDEGYVTEEQGMICLTTAGARLVSSARS
jgi:hypothetical protein